MGPALDPTRFVHVGFEPSRTRYKKYDALLRDKPTGKIRRVPFGDARYPQFRDKTGLRLYSHLDHLDKTRRARYLSRHKNDKDVRYSAGWFAAKYLW